MDLLLAATNQQQASRTQTEKGQRGGFRDSHELEAIHVSFACKVAVSHAIERIGGGVDGYVPVHIRCHALKKDEVEALEEALAGPRAVVLVQCGVYGIMCGPTAHR